MGGGCTPCLFRPSQTQFLTPQTSVRDACISEKNPKQNPKGKKRETNIVYHTRTYANVRIRLLNWTYANITN